MNTSQTGAFGAGRKVIENVVKVSKNSDEFIKIIQNSILL